MSQGSRPRVSIWKCFAELSDPRRRKVLHPLVHVVVIAICAVICGADDFVSIAEFGRMKRKWFTQFMDLSAGTPSPDCFNRVFTALKVRVHYGVFDAPVNESL